MEIQNKVLSKVENQDVINGTFLIPSDGSITSIGYSAFHKCTALKDIIIPDCVTEIGWYAFHGCSNLTHIKIPNSVTEIGLCAFHGCNHLTSITIPFVGNTIHENEHTHFGYIFGALVDRDNGRYVPKSLETVVVTGGTKVDDYAFMDCDYLTNIVLPDSLMHIGNCAFENCKFLTHCDIPDSVISLGRWLFSGCYYLNERS